MRNPSDNRRLDLGNMNAVNTNMKPTFRVTYSIVTPESAEQGDFAESGYYSRGGWKYDDPSDWTLHDIVAEFGRNSLERAGRWFGTIDPRIDYQTGADTSYDVHMPENITAASFERVRRVLDYRCRVSR